MNHNGTVFIKVVRTLKTKMWLLNNVIGVFVTYFHLSLSSAMITAKIIIFISNKFNHAVIDHPCVDSINYLIIIIIKS